MFDNLLNLVKEHAGSAIVNNADIPNEKNNAAIESATESIFDTFKSKASGGNMDSITDLFKHGASSNNQLAGDVSNSVANDLMKKFGLNTSQAGNIASGLVPKVLQNLVSKTNDPNDKSFDLQTVLASLGGGNLSGLLGKFL
jgi:uncharacterized protein YidB (DUF937 family)